MAQREFDWETGSTATAEGLTIDERFAIWAEAHPDVLALIHRFAEELRLAGRTRIGIKSLWERARWEYLTSAHGGEPPALNNIYTSRVARWLIDHDARFGGLIELRELKSR